MLVGITVEIESIITQACLLVYVSARLTMTQYFHNFALLMSCHQVQHLHHGAKPES